MSDVLAIFDMDGVVFATDRAKRDALADCFPSEYRAAIDAYNVGAGGIPRSMKFDYIFNEICPEIRSRKSEIKAAYDALTGNLFRSASLVPGIVEFLAKPRIGNWLATAAPISEAKEALAAHNIDQHFDRIFGFPNTKVEALEAANATGHATVFFGDSASDYIAAQKTETNFIGVEYETKGRFAQGTRLISSFKDKGIQDGRDVF